MGWNFHSGLILPRNQSNGVPLLLMECDPVFIHRYGFLKPDCIVKIDQNAEFYGFSLNRAVNIQHELNHSLSDMQKKMRGKGRFTTKRDFLHFSILTDALDKISDGINAFIDTPYSTITVFDRHQGMSLRF